MRLKGCIFLLLRYFKVTVSLFSGGSPCICNIPFKPLNKALNPIIIGDQLDKFEIKNYILMHSSEKGKH
jgi:hypothetical protein